MPVRALLNFNEVNGSQTFTDATANQTWSMVNGASEVITTANPRVVGGGAITLTDTVNQVGLNTALLDGLSGDYTVEFFYRSDDLVVNQGERGLVRLYEPNGTDYLALYISTGLNIVYFNSNRQGILVSGAMPISLPTVLDGAWVHIALCRGLNEYTLFIQGIKVGRLIGTLVDSVNNVNVGSNSFGFTKGYIDDFRITDGILYEFNFVPNVSDLGLAPTPNSISGSLEFNTPQILPDQLILPFNGGIYNFGKGVDTSPEVVTPDPTSTNIISGNVLKLGLPFQTKVVAVSLELNSKVLGYDISDSITGDYSIDVYPWEGEVMVYTVPDYGLSFNAGSSVVLDQLIHPTVPNKSVYKVITSGSLGVSEPAWDDSVITSGTAVLAPQPLYRPLINGFIKPVVTPI